MRAIGIAVEYNPFHNGHQYHINEIKKRAGYEVPIVAVMSGDFVQRGEPAAFSKYLRAEMAVRAGVSLVLENPLPWALSSAEGFARGAVGIMAASGVVDAVSFGTEKPELAMLLAAASAMRGEEYQEKLREYLAEGLSYAASMQKALSDVCGKTIADVLSYPNASLGIEYIKVAGQMNFHPEFMPVQRVGSSHDGDKSASEIRNLLFLQKPVTGLVPDHTDLMIKAEMELGRGPVHMGLLHAAVMSRLRMLEPEDFSLLPDVGEGLDVCFFKAVQKCVSPEEILFSVKSKRYALSRLRRILMSAVLGVQKRMAEGVPPYVRVLGMDEKGRELLRLMKKQAQIPIVSTPSAVRQLDVNAQKVFNVTAKAHDFYKLAYADIRAQLPGEDWVRIPYIQG